MTSMTHTGRGPVHRSALCWLAACAVYVLGTAAFVVLVVARSGEILTDGDTTPDSRTSLTTFLIVVAVLTVVVAGLVAFLASRMRAGRSWARTILTVFGVVAILANGLTIGFSDVSLRLEGQDIDSGATGLVNLVVGVLTIVLVLAALILQWRPAAREHFS